MELLESAAEHGSTLGLVALATAIIVKAVFEYLAKRVRVPLKRAHDEHVEQMTKLLNETVNQQRALSAQQERTAIAVERLDDKVDGVSSNIKVLLDRGER